MRAVIRAGLILLWASAALLAQDGDKPPRQESFDGKIVREIEFIGAELASPDSVRAQIKTKIGQPLDSEVLNSDLKRLTEELRLFSTASTRLIPRGDDGVKISFFVTENPRVEVVIFLGNEEYDRKTLLELIGTREGGLVDEITLQLDVTAIREKYLADGFHFVQVKYERPEDQFTTIVFRITEGPEVSIEDVSFRGNLTFDKGELLEAMPFTDEAGFLFGHPYSEKDVIADLVTLQQFYKGRGFLDARVALEDRQFSADKEEAYLTIRIDEGEPYLIRSIRIEGMQRFDEAETLAAFASQVGQRYEAYGDLAQDIRRLESSYYDESFINVDIKDVTPIPFEGREMDVVLKVVEGNPVKVGRVEIRGNTETRDKVIRRLLEDLAPGSPLNLNTLQRAKRRLRSTQYFQPETLEVLRLDIRDREYEAYRDAFLRVEDTARDDVKDIIVELEEKETGSIRFAAGVNSNTGLVGAIVYRKENFDPFDFPTGFDDILDAFTGGGQTLELAFYPGFIETQFQITYLHPFIFDSDYEFSFNGFRRIRFREGWDETRTGMILGLGKRFGRNITLTARYRLENVEVDDIDSDVGQIVFDYEGARLISSLSLSATIADLDNFGSPTEGYRLYLTYEYAGLGGDITFNRTRVDAEYYLTIAEDADGHRQVLWFDGTFAWVKEAGSSDDVPIYERYFAGGQSSLRGFAFRGVGPMTNNNPDGGKVLILGSLNYIVPLYEDTVAGVLFADAGTLATDFDSGDLGDFRLSIGFGIRLKVPFLGETPFAIDFGFPVLKQRDDETQIISFSLSRQF
ncbi:MAG: BamA/TamA family outer membrane protein [Planctomycetota bacterium]